MAGLRYRFLRTMVVGFFFLSGACALVYEVLWVRQLLLLVGATTPAVSTVLGVFMAGLGLGAWWLGPLADRSPSPLKLYGYLEAGIGLYGLALPSLLQWATPPYVALARALQEWPAALLACRVALGFLLFLCPTVLMGGTLPVLVRFVGRRAERFGVDLGTLYGANLAGGVAGSLGAVVLVRGLGVQGATTAAVLVSLSVGLAALLWAARAPAADGSEDHRLPQGESPALFPAAARPLVWAAVFLSGFLCLAYEVLWTRILIFAASSTVYAFSLILATFLAGLALGSRLFVAAEKRSIRLAALAGALVLAGLSALLLAPVSARATQLVDAVSARFGLSGASFLAGTAVAAALVILVPATLMGLVLPLAMRLLVDDLGRAGQRVGAAYLLNALGSVAGSLAAGFALIPLLGLKGTLLLLASAQVALGCAFLPHTSLPRRARGGMILTCLVLLLLGLAGAGSLLRGPNPFDVVPRLGAGGPPVIEAHVDGVTASVTVVRHPGVGRSLRIDGFEAASDDQRGGYMSLMTHIPMLLHPRPQRLLVICFGTGTTAGSGLLHPGASVHAVDINPAVFDFASYFHEANRGVAGDPRARLIVDDGRNYLLTSRERYDVITSEPMPPRFAGMVNLYSREYYLLARERLTPGGFVAQWLPMHLLTYEEALEILRTVLEVFPETTLWLHDKTGIIVARREAPIRIEMGRVRGAFAPGPLRDDLERLGLGDALGFAGLFVLGPEAVRAATARVRPVTDDRPSLEFHTPRNRSRVFHGPYDIDQARAMELVLRLSVAEPMPLAGATPAEAAALAARRAWTSLARLGDLYGDWGLPERASVEYEAASRSAAEPSMRAALLMWGAGAARAAGRTADARRLAEESLAILPEDIQARAFLDSLGDPSRPLRR